MSNFSELQVRRRLMRDYIRRSAVGAQGMCSLTFELLRPVYIKSNTGGKELVSTTTIPAQIFALMPFKRRQTIERAFNLPSSGRDQSTHVEYLLIAEVDADVEKGDKFEWEGNDYLRDGVYEVIYVAARHADRKLVGVNYLAVRS